MKTSSRGMSYFAVFFATLRPGVNEIPFVERFTQRRKDAKSRKAKTSPARVN
jgi:hypothetical protein